MLVYRCVSSIRFALRYRR